MKKVITQASLIVAIVLFAKASAVSATFTNLYNFSAVSGSGPLGTGTNNDGAEPMAGLVSDGVKLYGTTTDGGTNGLGVVYAIGLNGSGFTNLHNFEFPSTNGAGPSAGLVLSGGVLYGTARAGGTNGLGTIFAINTNGTGFGKLHDFGLAFTGRNPDTDNNINSGGAFPETDLVLSGNTLYGATEQGGSGGGGTLFKINTDGSSFMLLHNFTNADGDFPSVRMVVIGTNLYGTTEFGGTGSFLGNGTIFRVGTDGGGFTNLYDFNGTNAASPDAGLVLSGNTLYGTANEGDTGLGGAPYGSVFSITPDGSNFTVVYVLNPALNAGHPTTGLAVSGNAIYATDLGFDSFGDGVFRVNTDGSGFTNLTSFNSPGDPGNLAALLLSGGNLYCAGRAGANGSGDVFELILGTPLNRHLNLQLANNTVVLTWTEPSLSLYTSPTANGVFTKISGATSPYTNSISNSQQFFEIK
jgi:uncharacterized repeat protein (TIGR03803 family)